jgi:hypothetical protein
MRPDMAKVLVERPRLGGTHKIRKGYSNELQHGLTDVDGLPAREGIKAVHSHRKWFNEHLGPLRRYLDSQVGRPWDKVYAEVCQRINRDSAVQLHIWQHLVQFVCTDPHVISGDVRRWGGRRWFAFYVDPKSRLLRENPEHFRWRSLRPRPKPPCDRIRIDDTREYRLMEGLWYELTFAPIPEQMYGIYDAVLKKGYPALTPTHLYECHGRAVYVARKRQLNKKELRRLPNPR